MNRLEIVRQRLSAWRLGLILGAAGLALGGILLSFQGVASAAEDQVPSVDVPAGVHYYEGTVPPQGKAPDQTVPLEHGTLTIYKVDPQAPDVDVTEECDDEGRCTFRALGGEVMGEIVPAP